MIKYLVYVHVHCQVLQAHIFCQRWHWITGDADVDYDDVIAL